MSDTLVIQSHRAPLPYPWIARCLESVRDWSAGNRFEYRFAGDELFAQLPAGLLEKTRGQPVIATDLARLRLLQDALRTGYRTVIWLDADFLLFDPASFRLPATDCAVGREVWVQEHAPGRLKVYRKVHNAFLMFRAGNSLLDFYADTAARLLERNRGGMPPQFLGPKLLTALHNVAQLPVLECAGMLSPPVCRDIMRGGGPALELFVRHSAQPPAGANLCISSCEHGALDGTDMQRVIDALLNGQCRFAGGDGAC